MTPPLDPSASTASRPAGDNTGEARRGLIASERERIEWRRPRSDDDGWAGLSSLVEEAVGEGRWALGIDLMERPTGWDGRADPAELRAFAEFCQAQRVQLACLGRLDDYAAKVFCLDLFRHGATVIFTDIREEAEDWLSASTVCDASAPATPA